MPNSEELMDTVGQTISERKPGDVYLSTMDLTYAYGQLSLSPKTSVQCNFSLVGGKPTGTYRFRTGFYGLTTMPAEFQRVMDTTLSDERMGDRSENQGDWRKQTVDYWKRSNAKFGITDSAKNTGGKGDVSSGRTTGGRNNKREGFIRPMADLFQ